MLVDSLSSSSSPSLSLSKSESSSSVRSFPSSNSWVISLGSPEAVNIQAVKIVSGSLICWYFIHAFNSFAQELMSRFCLVSFSKSFNSFFYSLKLRLLSGVLCWSTGCTGCSHKIKFIVSIER